MTDLQRMTDNKRHGFVWGKYIQTHEIGDFQIVEFYPRKNKDGFVLKNTFADSPSFHPFVNGHDLATSTCTLEQALIVVIARKAGHQPAAGHICRMLEI